METREACAAHEEQARLGGTLRVTPIEAGAAVFYWAGETRRETPAELAAPDCADRHAALTDAYRERREAELASASADVATAPPDEGVPEEPTPRCPAE